MRWRSSVGLMSLLLGACGPDAGAPAPEEPRMAIPTRPVARSPWFAAVHQSLADGALAFASTADGFSARNRALGLRATFDAGGLVLEAPSGEVHVELTRWGRGRALEPAGLSGPRLGDCTDREGPDGSCIARLESEGDGIVEWWTMTAEGLEQGWTVERAPRGAGPLVIEMEIGGTAEVADGDAWIDAPDGGTFLVQGLSAWDARGVPLPARLVGADGVLRVVIDDAGAVLPITVDPMWSSPDVTYSGDPDTEWLGYVMDSGDFDGDGFSDLLVGAPAAGSHGSAYVYYGTSSGPPSTAGTELTESTVYQYGTSVANAGDVNGDGYDDVIVGAPNGGGAAFVYLGSTSGVSATSAASWLGYGSDALGSSVAGIGDSNGDGYDDVAVASTSSYGVVYVYHGGSAGPASSASRTIWGDYYSPTGHGLASADVNDDGYSDLVALYSTSAAAALRIHRGSASGVATTASASIAITGKTEDVAGAGDVNGDGYGDVVAGSPGKRAVYVYHGASSGTPTLATTISGSASLGTDVDGAGDVDGDGYDDIVAGDSGTAWVYYGSSSGVTTSGSSSVTGNSTDMYGMSVAGAGDADGDGYDDVAVGAYLANGDGGQWDLFAGATAGLSTPAMVSVDGSGATSFGTEVAGVGDTNGDGYDDVAIGAVGYGDDEGAVFVYEGSGSGLPALASVTLYGPAASAWFGYLAGGPGDVNGDGFDDLVVGTYGTRTIYVFHGSAAGIATSAASSVTQSASGGFGTVLGFAGDVDGDGYDEVLAGAPSSGYGAWYLYHGSGSGLSPTAKVSVTGTSSYVQLGGAVAGVGDVNGDGYDDIAVADPEWDGVPTYNHLYGRVEFYRGSASGISTASTHLVLTGTVATGRVGIGIDGAGDVDGDGYDDAVVGSLALGAAWVYGGSATGLSSTAYDTLSGPVTGWFGTNVAGVGDVDGDGDDEVAVGTWLADDLYVFFGDAAGISSTADLTLTGPTGTHFGEVVDAAGDVDGDGLDDLIVGSTEFFESTGYVAVFYGASDADGDGYAGSDDCDDGDPDVSPAATELCNGADDDCDGSVDEGTTVTGYRDFDGDGYGDPSASKDRCTIPSGYVADGTDCDDGDPTAHPAATEACDGEDDDCDGVADEGATTTFYADADDDGHGAASATTEACAAPSGYVASADDCDDADATAYPGAAEACDGRDDDCDGSADDGLTETWYADADRDGYGDPATATDTCSAPTGYVTDGTDCRDTNDLVHPGATETPSDGVDSDCDGGETCFVDADGDGWRPDASTTVTSEDLACDGVGEASSSDPIGDCDDADAGTWPGAPEIEADGVDQDCDGADEGGGDTDVDTDPGDTDDHTDPEPTDTDDDTDPGATDTDDDSGVADPPKEGCGCASTGRSDAPIALLLLLALGRRRTRALGHSDGP